MNLKVTKLTTIAQID